MHAELGQILDKKIQKYQPPQKKFQKKVLGEDISPKGPEPMMMILVMMGEAQRWHLIIPGEERESKIRNTDMGFIFEDMTSSFKNIKGI